MRNTIKTTNVGGNTYSIFSDNTELGTQFGFSINNTEVADATSDATLASKIYDQLVDGVAAEVHLHDIVEDFITEAAMV